MEFAFPWSSHRARLTRTHSVAGVNVYHRQDGGGISDITLFVDNITLLGNSRAEIDRRLRDQRYQTISSMSRSARVPIFRYDVARGVGLHGFSDSSLGDLATDYHSTSGLVFLMADAAITWSSRKQKTTAQSTTQAEYMALTDAASQATWYHSFLTELSYKIPDSSRCTVMRFRLSAESSHLGQNTFPSNTTRSASTLGRGSSSYSGPLQ
jgi:hypothetical protein